MMRFATVDSNPADRAGLRDALRRCAIEAHHSSVGVSAFGSVDELSSALEQLRTGYFDVAVICADKPRPALNDAASRRPLLLKLEALHDAHPEIIIVLASRDTTAALDAYNLGAYFLLLSGGYEGIQPALAEALAHIGWSERACLAVRSASRVDNVAIEDIQFVESSKRGPVIHLPGGRTVTTRGTLKGLYDQMAEREDCLSEAEPLLMAGSSFIVNLDNVIASGKGALVFADGETIIVPVRKRKDIEDALDAYQTGKADIFAASDA